MKHFRKNKFVIPKGSLIAHAQPRGDNEQHCAARAHVLRRLRHVRSPEERPAVRAARLSRGVLSVRASIQLQPRAAQPVVEGGLQGQGEAQSAQARDAELGMHAAHFVQNAQRRLQTRLLCHHPEAS